MEPSPWKTPFGRLLIGSSIVAAVVGFALAAGVTTYFRTAAAAPEEAAADMNAADANRFDAPLEDPSLPQGYTQAQEQEPAAKAPAQDQYYAGGQDSYQARAPSSSDEQADDSQADDANYSADEEDGNQ